MYVANLATIEEFRGLGVAKFLLNYAENLALANKFKRCSLIAKDRYVSKFYEKLNYRTLQNYEVFGHEIIKMAKNI